MCLVCRLATSWATRRTWPGHYLFTLPYIFICFDIDHYFYIVRIRFIFALESNVLYKVFSKPTSYLASVLKENKCSLEDNVFWFCFQKSKVGTPRFVFGTKRNRVLTAQHCSARTCFNLTSGLASFLTLGKNVLYTCFSNATSGLASLFENAH